MKRSREDFEKKLIEFFERHDEAKVDLAVTMSHRFFDHQDETFEHLSEVYHEKEGIDVTEDAVLTTSFGSGSTPY